MTELNFPQVSVKSKRNEKGDVYLFDFVRRKWLAYTPEEWVRQNLLAYLVQHLNYPAGLIAIEKSLKYNKLEKRFDALVFKTNGAPILLIECKRPNIKLNQHVFQQIAMYNFELKVPYLLVSNGVQHIFAVINANKTLSFKPEIPAFHAL